MNDIYPYPYNSTNLIDFFLICGYEYSYIYNNLLKIILEEFENEANQNDKNLFTYIPKFKPSILNSICSFDYQKEMISEKNIIDYTFLDIPEIYYNDKNKIKNNKNINSKNIIFLNSSIATDTKNIYNTFAYIFYENFSIKNIEVFIPKAFIFISEHSFFKLYKNISEEFLIQYKNDKLEIPIEFQIFNIINFLPNSIKNSINLFLFQEFNLKDNNNINEPKENKLKLDKISGYTFFDIDISEIFKIVPVDLLIEVFIFSFLEFKINIFYNDLEFLNLFIYIINSFSYPLETQYNWQVISLSKSDIFDQENSIIDKPIASILGFNCSYNNEIENRFQYIRSHFSFDMENKIFEFYCEDKEELDNIKTLQVKIKKTLKNKEPFFHESLNILYDKLISIYDKKFKDVKKFSEKYNFFDSKDNYNREIQEAFYEFNINFGVLFYKFFKNNKENNKIDICYKFDDKDLNKEEKIFFNFFEITLKNGDMIDLFEQQKYIFSNSLSYMIYNEIINLKKLNNSFNNYFDLINYFYNIKDNNILNIDFVNFYNYYQDNLKEYFFNESKYSKIINSFKKKDNNNNSYLYYSYNIIEIDNNLLFKYINLINNLSQEEYNKIFIDYKNNIILNNHFKYIDFFYQFEDYFLSKNIMNKKDLIIYMIFYLIIFLIQKFNLEYFSNIIQQNLFLLKFNLNKNIELIFECYLKLLQNNVKILTNFSFFSNIIEILLIHKNNLNINIVKLYSQIINFINQNNYEFSNEKNGLVEKILDIEISELYNIKLMKINNNEIINEIELFKKNIEDNNEFEILYKNEIMINFISNCANKNININCEIYSIKFLYNEIKLIINDYLLSYDFDKINKKKLNFVLINLIFYIDYIFKFSNKLSKLVYLCLSEEN